MSNVRFGNIQYVSDTLLIEKLFLIDAGLYKQAGALDLLESIGPSIKDWAKEHIDTSSVTGVLTSLADLMVPGILFKINPLLGGLAVVAQVLGFSPSMIVKKILTFLRPKLESGESIDLDEVNSVGKGAVAEEAGPMEATASKDMFYHLREIEKRGELIRLSYGYWPKEYKDELAQHRESFLSARKDLDTQFKVTRPDIPFFGGSSPSIIERVFGQLFRQKQNGKARWLLGGFVVWIVKTVLLGAGLIAAGEKIKGLFHSNHTDVAPKPSNQPNQPNQPKGTPMYEEHEGDSYAVAPNTPAKSSRLTPSGYGQEQHINDTKTSTWYVPVVGGTIESTLIAWAGYVYDELKGRGSLIVTVPSFGRIVSEMRSNFEPGAAHIQVPSKYKSIKQVVDGFANDVAAKL